MDDLERFLASKQQERGAYEPKLGWSKWALTHRGEEKQGWIRWNNTGSACFETPRQIIFTKDNKKYKLVESNDEGLTYCMFSFDSAEEAMSIAKDFTSRLDIMTDAEMFDQMRYITYRRCVQEYPPELEMHHQELKTLKGARDDMMTKEESDQFRIDYSMMFIEDNDEPYVIKVAADDPGF